MHRFWDSIIAPLCDAAGVRTIVEIGSGSGMCTNLIVAYAKEHGGRVHTIDPNPGPELESVIGEAGSCLVVHRSKSLEVLPTLAADVVLIDGDHNWYTVFHELEAIAAWHEHPLIFLHDTEWPYGRRDVYYDAPRIPEEDRHRSLRRGMDPSFSELSETGGLSAHMQNACHEGGAHNGVRTAIEDFLQHHGKHWHWQHLPGMHGLGMLVPENRLQKSPQLPKLLLELQPSPLLRKHMKTMETDRIGYLIRTQDQDRALRAAISQREHSEKHNVEREERIVAVERELRRMQQTRSWRWTKVLRIFEARLWLLLCKRRVLVIDEKPLAPEEDSASLRMQKWIEILRAVGCDVAFQSGEKDVREHLSRHGGRYHAVVLSRAPVAARHFADVRSCAPQAHIIFDTVDLHGLRLRRKAVLTRDPKDEAEARECLKQEQWLATNADCTVAVSEREAEILRESAPGVAVFTVSNIHDPEHSQLPFEKRKDILFVGNFAHAPNADAVRYFLNEIFPHVRTLLPGIRFHVIGKGSKTAFGDKKNEDILVHGHVPNLSAHIRNARLTVAPLRFGAGVKGKIHSSLACGTPIVTTSIGAEGMHLEHERDCLIAESPLAFAQAIERLYTDRALWEKLTKAGQKNLRVHFSAEVAKARCREMFRYLDTRPLPARQ